MKHGPRCNEKIAINDLFKETLEEERAKVTIRLIIMGDLNCKVGRNNEENHPLGQHDEDSNNGNGQRVIDFCLNIDMVVGNNHFKRNDIHKT